MDTIKEFLESSSINGMSLISSTRRFTRLFWILIVLGGFASAIYLIFESFNNWRKQPISTTIETLPISELTFPNVTVCPPKGLFLNLNQDIQKSETVTLNQELRNELVEYALDVIQDQIHIEMMTNLSKVQDPDRYYNWYHGFTRINYPNFEWNQLCYYVYTSAASGNISTQYFGDKFEADKVEGNIFIDMYIFVPAIEENTTILINLEKNTISEFSSNDMLTIYTSNIILDPEIKHWSSNISITDFDIHDNSYFYNIDHNRLLSDEDIFALDMDLMPGFRLSWNYNKHLEPDRNLYDSILYNDDATNDEFVRLYC